MLRFTYPAASGNMDPSGLFETGSSYMRVVGKRYSISPVYKSNFCFYQKDGEIGKGKITKMGAIVEWVE